MSRLLTPRARYCNTSTSRADKALNPLAVSASLLSAGKQSYTVFPVAANGAGMAASAGTGGEEQRIGLLSDKELVILQMLSKGMSNKAIGDALFISNKTVSSHKTRIMQKLGVKSLVELIDLARRCRLASVQ